MEEPMDEGSPSRIPGLDLAGNPPSEDAPASASSPPLARRSDRIQDLLGKAGFRFCVLDILTCLRDNYLDFPLRLRAPPA
jgi:hypothetical protein